MALKFLIDRIIKQREYGTILLDEIAKEKIEERQRQREMRYSSDELYKGLEVCFDLFALNISSLKSKQVALARKRARKRAEAEQLRENMACLPTTVRTFVQFTRLQRQVSFQYVLLWFIKRTGPYAHMEAAYGKGPRQPIA